MVILNPSSGRGSGARLLPSLRQILADRGVAYDLAQTEGLHHAVDLARQASLDGYETVVAVGGDGTISEVVNGLALAAGETEIVGTLGVIPVGTGNDFADMAGIPRKTEEALAVIRAGRSHLVDLGRFHIRGQTVQDGAARAGAAQGQMQDEYRYFNNNLGCGFEAQVTVESRKIQRLRGFAVYLTAIFKALISYPLPDIAVSWTDEDGRAHQVDKQMLMISIGNSRRTGGGFYVTPDAIMDDGLYDLAMADGLSRGRIMVLLPKVMMGTHPGDPALTFVRARQIRITSPSILPVHADGEIISRNADELEITIQPQRLRVLTPGLRPK